MTKLVESILAGVIVVGAVLGVIALCGAFAIVGALVPWALYNFAVAPLFDWPHCAFWKFFLILWAVTWLKNFFFPTRKATNA